MEREPDYPRGLLIPGDYVLERPLGAGQDGEVWCAVRRRLNKTVAVKFLNAVDDEEKIKRFNTEIEILASLHHPNIISISDKNEASNPRTNKIVPFYVMEFLEADPLDKYLAACPREKILKVFCALLEQAAMAIIEVHSKGLSHGDVKSANLMVVKKTGTAILTDFGFGLRLGDDARQRDEYPSSSYKAPKGLTSQQADIYRLGRTFLDALALVQERLVGNTASELAALLTPLTEEASETVLELVMSRLESVKENAAGQRADKASRFEELTAEIPELSTSPRGSVVSDPVQGYVTLTGRVRAIVDLPEFQRLRHLEALPECALVYPAMTQTRLECALGAFGQMVKYIRALADLPPFRSACDAGDIRIALAGCLLRELGQYPFSDIVSEASSYSESYDPLNRSAQILLSPAFADVARNSWGAEPERIAHLFLSRHPEELSHVQRLVGTLLNGTISAASVDHLLRTSGRAGMLHAFDEPRFTRSIRLAPDTLQIAFPIGRLTVLEDFLTAKYALIERVYRAPTARSARQMLLHAFVEIGDLGDLLQVDDNAFLGACISRAQERGLPRASQLLTAYQKRNILKRFMTWHPDRQIEIFGGRLPEFMSRFDTRAKKTNAFSSALENALSNLCRVPLPPGSIIFDFGQSRFLSEDVPVLDTTGNIHRADEASPTIRSITAVAELNLCSATLFASVGALGHLQRLPRHEIEATVSSFFGGR
jgi:HD superfamily phosphohydrolase